MSAIEINRIYPPSAESRHSARAAWRESRLERENTRVPRVWWRRALRRSVSAVGKGQRFGPLAPMVRASTKIQLRQLEFRFNDLPAAFDGFTLLHLSDLHLDHVPGLTSAIVESVRGLRCDLLVFTGDYQDNDRAAADRIAADMRRIVLAVESQAGAIGVLGNHDSAELVEPLEAAGITLLLNEIVELSRGGERILITGTDDVHYFSSALAEASLAATPEGFAIALVHSAEAADWAARRHRLMLCGHTHGGQVCLPGGYAPVRSLKRYRTYYRGLWRHEAMTGFTNAGIGTAVIPIRLNCPAEIVSIVLRRGERA
jgi:predicted MPP superfamily phosphohydrolase